MRNIGAVILAAGESSRLGQPKQLIQFRGKSLIRRVVEAADKAGCSPIVVVTGGGGGDPEKTRNLAESVASELKQTPATIVTNENWRHGIGSSIRAGVQGAIETAQGQEGLLDAIVLLTCDQPFVDARTIERLIALREKTGQAIIASSYSNTLGVPALFDCSYFEELLLLSDASGAKSIILRDRDRVAEFPFPEGEIDIDTAEDYEKLVISE